MPEFPECFPEDFERMLPEGHCYSDYPVYRIAKRGTLDRSAFFGSIEEDLAYPISGKKPRDPNEVTSYSTSCCEGIGQARNSRNLLAQYNPPAVILYGKLKGVFGPSWKKPRKDHVHWWIYKDADPCPYFEELTEDE